MVDLPAVGPPVPSPEALDRARRTSLEREPRARVYDTCTQMLAQALESGSLLSASVPVAALLYSWNSAYYRDGREFDTNHFSGLERATQRQLAGLRDARTRSIAGLVPADEPRVVAMFSEFEATAGPIGASKALHLWAPAFFPMWDYAIAAAYGLDLEAGGSTAAAYWRFMQIVRAQAAAMPRLADRSSLKALDEHNYGCFTRGWMDTS